MGIHALGALRPIFYTWALDSESQRMGEKLIAQNRRARREYHVLDTFEAGIELKGTEVKSLRNGAMTLKDSYVDIQRGELFLVSAHIPPYVQASVFNHEPERPRRLLMHKREIEKLASKVAERGLTIVPLRVYFKGGKVKVEIGLCRGKQFTDKRAALKEQEATRDMERAIRERQKE